MMRGCRDSSLPTRSVVLSLAGDLITSQTRESVARATADQTAPSGWNSRDLCFNGVSTGMDDQLAGRPY